jgi:hypothetical protein
MPSALSQKAARRPAEDSAAREPLDVMPSTRSHEVPFDKPSTLPHDELLDNMPSLVLHVSRSSRRRARCRTMSRSTSCRALGRTGGEGTTPDDTAAALAGRRSHQMPRRPRRTRRLPRQL